MARRMNDDDDDAPEDSAAVAAAAVEGIEAPPDDKTPMKVHEDGTVTFGDSDARGEGSAKVGDDGDEEETADMTTEEREKLRAKRRDEKKRRREAQRERENSLKGENAALHQTVNELATRLQQVEQRTTSIDVGKLEEDLRGAAYAVQSWQAVFEEAVKNADGAAASNAMQKINQATEEGKRLYAARQSVDQQAQNRGRPAVDPEVMTRVDRWRSNHGWYNPSKPDRDTRIALAVDASVAADGYRPNTDEFWAELDNRLREVLPQRYADIDDLDDAPAPAASRSGTPAAPAARNRRVAAGGGGNAGGSSPAPYKVSSERVQAMKDAGVWNDPAKRDKMIRGYMAYDKANKPKGN